MTNESKNSEDVDIWRDTPIRLLGYANEVGESFRSLVSRNLVRLSYGVAFGYVLADTADKTKKASKGDEALVAVDTLVWQTLASVAIPGFTINRLCALSLFCLVRWSRLGLSTQKWLTTGIGLSSIPFIVKPIDKSVDYILDNSLRPVLFKGKSGH